MLDAAAQGGELGERRLAAGEKILQKGRRLGLLVGWNGECTMKCVHDHASICYTLGRRLALVVAKAKAELRRQTMPPVLGAPGLAGKLVADRAAAGQAEAGGMRKGLGDVDRIVHPHGTVEGRGMEAAWGVGTEGHL